MVPGRGEAEWGATAFGVSLWGDDKVSEVDRGGGRTHCERAAGRGGVHLKTAHSAARELGRLRPSAARARARASACASARTRASVRACVPFPWEGLLFLHFPEKLLTRTPYPHESSLWCDTEATGTLGPGTAVRAGAGQEVAEAPGPALPPARWPACARGVLPRAPGGVSGSPRAAPSPVRLERGSNAPTARRLTVAGERGGPALRGRSVLWGRAAGRTAWGRGWRLVSLPAFPPPPPGLRESRWRLSNPPAQGPGAPAARLPAVSPMRHQVAAFARVMRRMELGATAEYPDAKDKTLRFPRPPQGTDPGAGAPLPPPPSFPGPLGSTCPHPPC